MNHYECNTPRPVRHQTRKKESTEKMQWSKGHHLMKHGHYSD